MAVQNGDALDVTLVDSFRAVERDAGVDLNVSPESRGIANVVTDWTWGEDQEQQTWTR